MPVLLEITQNIQLSDWEIDFQAIRAQGSGGQNVNKVSSAVHLRFDIEGSTLPVSYKERLLRLSDQRITQDGVIVIKAQSHRTLEKNKEDALQRLKALIQEATAPVKARRTTRPTRSSQRKRMDKKSQRGKIKALRGKPVD